ncbi:uncharacterized protein M421DRAFT_110665 [Didymella exigua CBS 183.55]|uniref:Uncharacterized protein n=1 Tax=Didymella exigua CBS 183.55 TaxID=1150837 RepID=A0A6A5S318_9PLEO|nr:uncharacterized protein M421DRAFT_110665 [Didymella exigua CBS 183.55]KAF1934020.1 hypothetical protein M421DRAFT_110665 [Didymella exigua CBS 183.55]
MTGPQAIHYNSHTLGNSLMLDLHYKPKSPYACVGIRKNYISSLGQPSSVVRCHPFQRRTNVVIPQPSAREYRFHCATRSTLHPSKLKTRSEDSIAMTWILTHPNLLGQRSYSEVRVRRRLHPQLCPIHEESERGNITKIPSQFCRHLQRGDDANCRCSTKRG